MAHWKSLAATHDLSPEQCKEKLIDAYDLLHQIVEKVDCSEGIDFDGKDLLMDISELVDYKNDERTDELEGDVEDLRNEVEELEDKVRVLREENDEFRETISQLEEQLTSLTA